MIRKDTIRMEYTVSRLAKLSGVSRRTLQFYDEIGLLKPARTTTSGYRIYGQHEVDTLQEILIYRELGFPLEEIRRIMSSTDFTREKAMSKHLSALMEQKRKIETLIENVTKTIGSMKGEVIMSDNEKFEGLKKQMLEENEKKYGKEIRERWGEDKIAESNKKFAGITKEQMKTQEELASKMAELLRIAVKKGDPSCAEAQAACELHRQWLCVFWSEGTYTKAAHKGLAQMYVDDERFFEYYEKICAGCAEFLRDAINIYCKE